MAACGGSGLTISPIMEFRPSWEEFKDFKTFIQTVENTEAHRGGLAKVSVYI